jgi:hypothetical protein
MSNETQEGQEEVRRSIQHIAYLLHSSACVDGNSGICAVLHCTVFRPVWVHLMSCQDTDCTFQYCTRSKDILMHFRNCPSHRNASFCAICSPAREVIDRLCTTPREPCGTWRDIETVVQKVCGEPACMIPAPTAHTCSPVALLSVQCIGTHNQSLARYEGNETNDACTQMLDQFTGWEYCKDRFEDPVNIDLFPDYFTVVVEPMCLQDIRRKLKEGLYATCSERFSEDMVLLLDNAIHYNNGNALYTIAESRLTQFHYAWRSFSCRRHNIKNIPHACPGCRVGIDPNTNPTCVYCGKAYHSSCVLVSEDMKHVCRMCPLCIHKYAKNGACKEQPACMYALILPRTSSSDSMEKEVLCAMQVAYEGTPLRGGGVRRHGRLPTASSGYLCVRQVYGRRIDERIHRCFGLFQRRDSVDVLFAVVFVVECPATRLATLVTIDWAEGPCGYRDAESRCDIVGAAVSGYIASCELRGYHEARVPLSAFVSCIALPGDASGTADSRARCIIPLVMPPPHEVVSLNGTSTPGFSIELHPPCGVQAETLDEELDAFPHLGSTQHPVCSPRKLQHFLREAGKGIESKLIASKTATAALLVGLRPGEETEDAGAEETEDAEAEETEDAEEGRRGRKRMRREEEEEEGLE